MTMGAGLLRRMAAQRQGAPAPDEASSIVAHLRLLLNTRRGACRLDPGYGLPDLTDILHGGVESVQQLEQLLCETIERHEPRLHGVTVRAQPPNGGELCLGFEVQARLGVAVVRLDTRVRRGGQVQLERRA